MQKRGRGRPPRRSDDSPQARLSQEADDIDTSGGEGASQLPAHVPPDQEKHVRIKADSAPAYRGDVREGSAPREHYNPRDARDPPPRRPLPAQRPPLYNGGSNASIQARGSPSPSLSMASPTCPPSYQSPLDVLSSVAFSIVAAIPSPLSTSSTSSSASSMVTASQSHTNSAGPPSLARSPPLPLEPPRAAVGTPASGPPACSDALRQLLELAGQYEGRASGRAADAREEKTGDANLQALWGPGGMMCGSPMMGQVLVGPDQLTVVFETLATTVTRLRMREQVDARKADFVRYVLAAHRALIGHKWPKCPIARANCCPGKCRPLTLSLSGR